MSERKFTPAPWGLRRTDTGPWAVFSAETGIWVACTQRRGWPAEDIANARLIAAAPALLEALEAYRSARSMPSTGDWAQLPDPPSRTYDASYGGGDCSKHGRYYGHCHCCENDTRKAREQMDRDAVHARDNALRRADDLARAAIAKALGTTER